MVKKAEARKRAAERKRVYKEFARIKYAKYKSQFPRLREAELVNKIMR